METRRLTTIEEINAIFTDGSKPVHFVWRCTIEVNGETIDPHRTLNIDINRHYTMNFAEEIMVELQVAPSQYVDKIYPNRQNITVTLYQIPLNEDGSENWDEKRYLQIYRGMIKGGKDLKLNPNREQGNSEDLDMGGHVVVEFQLVSRALEQLRLRLPGGPYRNTTAGRVLKSIFDQERQRIKVDSIEAITGVDMVPPDNTVIREHVVVDHGLQLIELPSFLQNRAGGIYNADIAFFLQGDKIYIWPKYGLDRKERDKQVLTIFDIPANQFPGVERTYRETLGQVIILTTGNSSNTDVSEALDLNQGNGIRFTDAMSVLNGMIEMVDGKPIARRGASASEFVDEVRQTGLNFAPIAKERITSNAMKMASKLAPRKGMTMQLTWENANPFLVYPGMPVRIYTPRDGVLEERKGVLADAQFFIAPKAKTAKNSQQACVGHLAVFVSRATVEDQLPDIPAQ
jgi:hypothetical protein